MNLTQIRNILKIFKVEMFTPSKTSLVPIGVRGMKNLDREKFTRTITVPALKVPEEKLSKITQLCKPYFLKLENFKPVQDLTEKSCENFKKCIYFDPDKVSKWESLLEDIRKALQQCNIHEKNFHLLDFTLTYKNFKYDTIFRAVLPENEELVSGFSQIGHIIHLNLRDHLLEYRSLIGQVLLDKIKTCRTVVNKTVSIDNTYRNFTMEVIAGEDDFFVMVKENRCYFQFDFSKVYWNPRLCKEHERILELLKPNDVLFDVFCGVGPFAVPAAKRNCKVFANDLNPESYKWLNHNADQNKVNKNSFKSYNMDGKDFIQEIFKCYISDICKGKEKLDANAKIHVTMNLPAMAVEFLKYFKGFIKEEELEDKFNFNVIIHVYCFTVGDDHQLIAKQMVNDNIGYDITSNIIEIFNVRNVSPKKEMMRVSFKLTREVIFDKCRSEEDSEPPCKIRCKEKTEI